MAVRRVTGAQPCGGCSRNGKASTRAPLRPDVTAGWDFDLDDFTTVLIDCQKDLYRILEV